MSPGNSVKGTHLVTPNDESEVGTGNNFDESPGILSPPTPGRPINSPIFPNLVQHNLDNNSANNSNSIVNDCPSNISDNNVNDNNDSKVDEPIASCLDGISRLEDQILNKSPRKSIKDKPGLFDHVTSTKPKPPGHATGKELQLRPITPKKSTPKKIYKPSPNKTKRKGIVV